VGGISALALLHRGFDVCLARVALAQPYLHIRAGKRGANLRLDVPDLLEVTGAKLVETS
jgi:Cys-tRNA(Pro)/Cys-tRNA(Cys) deacylase